MIFSPFIVFRNWKSYSNTPINRMNFWLISRRMGKPTLPRIRMAPLTINNWQTKETRTINTGLQFMSGDFSPDGSEIMLVHMDTWAASIYNVASGELITKISGFKRLRRYTMSNSVKMESWRSGSLGEPCRLSDISSNAMRPAIYHQDFISSFAASPNGELLVTAAAGTKNDTFVPFIFYYDAETSDVINDMEMVKRA